MKKCIALIFIFLCDFAIAEEETKLQCSKFYIEFGIDGLGEKFVKSKDDRYPSVAKERYLFGKKVSITDDKVEYSYPIVGHVQYVTIDRIAGTLTLGVDAPETGSTVDFEVVDGPRKKKFRISYRNFEKSSKLRVLSMSTILMNSRIAPAAFRCTLDRSVC